MIDDDNVVHLRPPEEFERDSEGKIRLKSRANVALALRLLGVGLSYNEFADKMMISGLEGFTLLNDPAIDRLWFLIDERFRFLPPRDFFLPAIKDLAREKSFHPVRDYLNGLSWDGKKRIDKWLTTYASAKATPYTRAVGRLFLIAAVRRVRQPGCKFDEMMVLVDPRQGTGKSELLKIMAVRDEWFSDDLPLTADSKKLIESLLGRWIIEASEMAGMRKVEHEHLKSMLSRTHDRSRLSYDRVVTELPRHGVIAGTTNDEKFLGDDTGNRRYWPIATGTIDLEALRRDRDQLWAEAAAMETGGESIRLAKELWPAATKEQARRLEDDPWKQILSDLLGGKQGKIRKSDVREIIGKPEWQSARGDAKRIGTIMRSLGWQDEKKQRFGQSDPQHCWYRGNKTKELGIKIELMDGRRKVTLTSAWDPNEPM